jgi:formylglycine-generating enzyme required for sulfatase activity
VPAGGATYGYSAAAIEPLAARIKRRYPGFTGIGFDDDVPEETVRVSAFCIDRTEATEASRAACQAAGACPPYVAAPLPGIPAERSPAIMPTEIDAAAYCAWRGGRLPTDAEWEAAARGDTQRALPWGDAWTGREANYCGSECPWGVPGDASDGVVAAAAVDGFDSPSPYGLLGTAGNLWEWVADCFVNAARRRAAGRQDPIAPAAPHCRRFLRGGSYASLAGILERRTGEGFPDVGPDTRGVRCAYDFGTVHQPFGESH